MKNIKLIILSVAAALCFTNVNAQGIKVYKSDKSVITISYNELDSIVACDYIGQEEFVDMGLSVKWATHNVGAVNPEDTGNYYAWGEVETKDTYNKDNCLYYKEELLDFGGNSLFDAATAVMGPEARMPKADEAIELIENSTFEWTEQKGVYGIVVTSKVNGNKIFLPATGTIYETVVDYLGEAASYWTSTPTENSKTYSERMYFNESSFEMRQGGRYYGQAIRAVMEY